MLMSRKKKKENIKHKTLDNGIIPCSLLISWATRLFCKPRIGINLPGSFQESNKSITKSKGIFQDNKYHKPYIDREILLRVLDGKLK